MDKTKIKSVLKMKTLDWQDSLKKAIASNK